MKDDADKLRVYYIFYLELMIGRFSLSKKKSILKDKIYDLIVMPSSVLNKDVYLYLLNTYYARNKAAAARVTAIANAVKLFGVRAFFKTHVGYFRSYRLGYVDLFIRLCFGQVQEVKQISSEIALLELEKNGLSRMSMFKHMKTKNIIGHFYPSYQAKNILNQVSQNNHSHTNAVLIGLLYQAIGVDSKRGNTSREGMQSIIDEVNAHSFAWMKEILVIDNKKEAYEYIENALNIQASEI